MAIIAHKKSYINKNNEVQMKNFKVLIMGMGPVGLATALGFAYFGYNIECYDVDANKIRAYMNGKLPFYEKNLEDFFDAYKTKLHFSCVLSEAIREADFIFITVGTPLSRDSSDGVEMHKFWTAVKSAVVYAKNQSLIVIKSTVPLGTNLRVQNYIEAQNLSKNIFVVSNPEFLAQGTSIIDTIGASRIVIGVNDPLSKERMEELYAPFSATKIFTNPISAELIKYLANSYLAMRVSFFNDVSNVCELANANVKDVIRGLTLDKRIGSYYCSPSIGFGGSCFPKDTFALLRQTCEKYGYNMPLIEATIDINERQKMKLCQKIHEDSSKNIDEEIAIIGLTFKPDTDDLRHSIAVENVDYLLKLGHKIVVWDPTALSKAYERWGEKISYSASLEEMVLRCKYIYITAEWPQIKRLELNIFSGKHVYDGSNCLLDQKEKISFKYVYLGGELNK